MKLSDKLIGLLSEKETMEEKRIFLADLGINLTDEEVHLLLMSAPEQKEYLYKDEIELALTKMPTKDSSLLKKQIINDLLYLEQETNFDSREYFLYEFYKKDRLQWKEFLASGEVDEIDRHLNHPLWDMKNKYEVYKVYKRYYHRKAMLFTSIRDINHIIDMVETLKGVILKPLYGSLGDDTFIIHHDDLSNIHDILQKALLQHPNGYIAEQLIKQTKSMDRLNPFSVNTLRITTIRSEGDIYTQSNISIGRAHTCVANFPKGCILGVIDQKSGKITNTLDPTGRNYELHPDTGLPLIGEDVPNLKEAYSLVLELMETLPECRYLGWDLALTDEGWTLIEVNTKPAVFLTQYCEGKGMRRQMNKIFSELNISARL